MTILSRFAEKENFTPTEQLIIDYLQSHQEELESLTIGQLAKGTFSSNASIIRLCQKCGYQGFRDFRLALVSELTSSRYLGKIVDFSRPFQIKESSQEMVNGLFSLYKSSIDQVQSLIDIPQLEEMAEQIAQSNRLFLFGYGDVKLTLKSFSNKLVKINYFPIMATENEEEHEIVPHITNRDVALFVSYRGKNEKMAQHIVSLRRQGVATFVITANQKSPLLPYSKGYLLIPDLEKEDKIGTFYSQLSFDYLLNLIYTFLYKKHYD